MDFNDFASLLRSDRSVRRFDSSRPVTRETLSQLVDLTRFCASGRNAQPLRYKIVSDPETCSTLYGALKWAGYFTWWDGPEPSERPVAYLVQCLDTRYGSDCLCDDGLQLQAITLGARTLGIASCIIKAFNRDKVSGTLGLDSRYQPRYVLALGYPAEQVVLEEMSGAEDADFRYYRTADGIHHVPKRPLSELLL
ncbi:MAG: nitroreductase family protein [Bacteroides sp.]|nr:nitroreductase family protein [Bacteroides sp.]